MKLPLRYNVCSLAQRKMRSALTVMGVAIAIFVSVMMIGLSRGLLSSTRSAATVDNVIVLSKGAESMEFSAIDRFVFHLLRSSQQIQNEGNQALASPEAYMSTLVRFPDSNNSGEKRGVVRGVWPVALQVHDQARIIEGSPPKRGFSVAVGKLAATKLGVPQSALAVGRVIEFEGRRWTIAGVFDTGGTVLDSEIWVDLDDLLVASKRNDYSSVVLRTKGRDATEELLFDLTTRTDIRVEAKTEEDYYAAAADALRPVRAVSITMTVILVLGVVMAGMNTMFTSILGRTREMGVLLVLGYKRKAVLLSFMLESVLLCLCGGLIGVIGGAFLNGLPMKIPMGAFRFTVDAATLGTGVGLSVAIGVFGALVPLLRVWRLQVVEALRAE